MKTELPFPPMFRPLLAATVLLVVVGHHSAAESTRPKQHPIPWSEIGAKAGAD